MNESNMSISINKIAIKILEEISNLQLKDEERKTYQALLDYTENIIKNKQLPNSNVNEIVESVSGNLLDSISMANTKHFITGMKAGAMIITQLLF